ncbi:glycerophosphoryl diester phosphodiesterase membrane domain-containing protein [Streptomyces sp. HNM0574]|uniref:DUF7847 domain-containing protein n=1 Tax=Streptomyces sp. HNM0574 TaxID=2714954 RepID=UPI00146C9324|nr:glycerophosphoryl diester phosphodiesterase membrane domain-containing protein [Streptomyces sp. HNM0574]NLU66916.1 hypothetical protein [Streptomyces sp. HNM0574]
MAAGDAHEGADDGNRQQPTGWGTPGPGIPPPPPGHAPGYGGPYPGGHPGHPGQPPGMPGMPGPAMHGMPGMPPVMAPPKPGVIPLAPLGVGDILGGVFTTIGRYWRQIYGLTLAVLGSALLVCAIAAGIGLAIAWGTLSEVFADIDNPRAAGGQIGVLVATGIGVLLVWMLVGLYTTAALHAVNAVTASHAVTGERADAGRIWRQARPRVLSVIGTQLLTGLIIAGIVLVGYAVMAGAVFAAVAGGGDGAGTVLGVLVAVLVGIALACTAAFLYVRLSISSPAAVLEGLGPATAMGRSWRLVRGSWWRVLGITLLMGILVAIVQQMLQYAIMLVTMLSMAASQGPDGEPSLGVAVVAMALLFGGIAVVSVLTLPFSHLTATLLYVDMRIRNEGFDLNLAAAAGLPPHRPVAP